MKFEPILTSLYLEGLCANEFAVCASDPFRGGVTHVAADGRSRRWLDGRKWIGGLMWVGANQILVSGEGGIVALDVTSGMTAPVVSEIPGRPGLGVNEMAADPRGGLYFGSLDVAVDPGSPPAPASIFYMSPNGQIGEVASNLKFSNGLVVSPDGSTLFHNETYVGTHRYRIAPDGSLHDPVLLLDKPDCDGMTADGNGNVWVTGWNSDKIICLRPDGSVADTIVLPTDGATSVRFGGPDHRDLLVTTIPSTTLAKLGSGGFPEVDESVLYRARVGTPGHHLPVPSLGSLIFRE